MWNLLGQVTLEREINGSKGEKGFKYAQQYNVNAFKCKTISNIRYSYLFSKVQPKVYAVGL